MHMSTYADTAAHLVLGSRNDDYGNPAPDFAGIALMWSGLLNTKLSAHITKEDVALMMCALKLRRQAHKPKADNLIAAHGYLLCAEWIESGLRPETEAAANWQAVEDVACGTGITCITCGKTRPCMCGVGLVGGRA